MEVREMIETVALAAGAVAAPVLGAWLHELTHALAAWAFGGEVVDIDLVRLQVDFRFEPADPWRERMVFLAPGIVGLLVLPTLLLHWSGAVTPWALVWALGWVIYTLNGGAEGELRLTGILQAAE